MEDSIIKESVNSAITMLKEERISLNFDSIHERTTTCRLAIHLQCLFSNFFVDCEYNEKGTDPKVISSNKLIIPDIIIHQRETNTNLLVIETKKRTRFSDKDEVKLKELTKKDGDYRYQLGLYIRIHKQDFDLTWYKDGQIIKA